MSYRFFMILLVGFFVGCGALDPQNHLENWVEQEKTTLPRKVHKYVRCVDVRSADSEIIYYYDVQGITDKQARDRRQVFEDRIREQLKKRPDDVQKATTHQIKITHIHRNEKGGELFRFTIKPWDN